MNARHLELVEDVPSGRRLNTREEIVAWCEERRAALVEAERLARDVHQEQDTDQLELGAAA